MKIIHIISGGDIGGAKTHVLTLIKALQQHAEVKLICFMHGEFYEEARSMGLPIELIPQKKRCDLSVINTMVQIIQSEKFDVIHSHGARANFLTFFVKRKVDLPCITTVHSDYRLDFQGNFYKNIIFRGLNTFCLKYFDYYIGVSESFKKMLVERGFSANQIFTVYNGIDFDSPLTMMNKEEFLKHYNLQLPPEHKIVGILGRLHPVKGHKVFLEAAREVLGRLSNVSFLIGGDGEEIKHLEDYACQLNIRKNIHFLGQVENPYDFMNVIDLNALTSYSESFPYVLLEGARLKKPTISSKVGGISDMIIHGENGYLFPPGDGKSLADYIVELLSDPQKSRDFGQKFYEYTYNHYSSHTMAQAHLKIYKQIILARRSKA